MQIDREPCANQRAKSGKLNPSRTLLDAETHRKHIFTETSDHREYIVTWGLQKQSGWSVPLVEGRTRARTASNDTWRTCAPSATRRRSVQSLPIKSLTKTPGMEQVRTPNRQIKKSFPAEPLWKEAHPWCWPSRSGWRSQWPPPCMWGEKQNPPTLFRGRQAWENSPSTPLSPSHWGRRRPSWKRDGGPPKYLSDVPLKK